MAEYGNAWVTNPDGTTKTGYTKDGLTYLDSNYTKRVGVGSIVDTAGGRYIMTENGGVAYSGETPSRPYTSKGTKYIDSAYNNWISQQRKLEEKANKAQRLAVNQGVNRINAQKPIVQERVDDQLRQAYIQNQITNRDMKQQLTAYGINGGATESAMLGSQSNYENLLNDTKQQGQNSLNDLDNSILDLQNTGDLNIANNAVLYSEKALDRLSQKDKDWINQFNFDNNFEYGRDRDAVGDDRWEREFESDKNYRDKAYEDGRADIERSDFMKLAASSNDYQGWINKLDASDDPDKEWKITYLDGKRYEKIKTEVTDFLLNLESVYGGNYDDAFSAVEALPYDSNTKLKMISAIHTAIKNGKKIDELYAAQLADMVAKTDNIKSDTNKNNRQ